MIKLSGQKKEIPIIYTKLRKVRKSMKNYFITRRMFQNKNNFILKTKKN